MRARRRHRAAVAMIGAAALALQPTVAEAQQSFESYYLYLGNDNPDQVENYWSHEAQGIAHDDDYWYISQATDLWRIPVGNDLNDDDPGVNTLHVEIENTNIGALGYDHFGDFEYIERYGTGYLLIPISAPDHEPCNAVAAFRADSLSYVDHVCVPEEAWAAFDPDGLLYFGNDDGLRRFSVRWDLLRDEPPRLVLENEEQIYLLNENGAPIGWSHNQGGDFSPDGTLVYVTTGNVGLPESEHGIHVFDTSTWRRVQRSTNGSGHFNYKFDPEETLSDEEPEGITIWDLDDGRAPGIHGQLHVILLDNDCGCLCPVGALIVVDCDDVYLKNYTGTIHVDGTNVTPPWAGTPANPYPTVSQANTLAWDGARIMINAGSYQETLTISERVRVTSAGGTVRIGQ